MSEHIHEDDLEERDDVVDDGDRDERPGPDEPWAKTSSGDADEVTSD